MDIRIVVPTPGAAENLRAAPYAGEAPGPGEIRVRHQAIGVNFIDVYQRIGLYRLAAPATPGVEAAGVVEALGDGVTHLALGDRVAYAGAPGGAYASTRLLPATRALALPDAISARDAAASLLKGLTAHMLLNRTFAVGTGDVVLIHAAAGGLGETLVRWAKRLGARVIGVVGDDLKAAMARAAGADCVVVGRNADFVAAALDYTGGRGVDFAIDGVGGATLAQTLAAVRKFGVVASIGQTAGPIPPFAVEALGPVRSIALARPSVMAYSAEPEAYARAAAAVWEAIVGGLSARIGGEYPLAEAARSHRNLEAGTTSGSLLLVP